MHRTKNAGLVGLGIFAAAWLSTTACGGTDGEPRGADPGADAASSSSSGGPITTRPDGAGASSSSSSGASDARAGGIGCIDLEHRDGLSETLAASFGVPCDTESLLAAEMTPGTERVREGACVLFPGAPQLFPPDTSLSAGRLTFTGQGGEALLEHGGSYFVDSSSSPLASAAGGTVAVVAAGDEVPAFSSSFAVPAKITMTEPSLTEGQHLALTRTAPLALAWPAAPAGTRLSMVLSQSPFEEDAEQRTILCDFDAAAGVGSVPRALLAELDLEPVEKETRARFSFYVPTSITAGSFDVTVHGAQMAFSAGGSSLGNVQVDIAD